MIKRNNSTSPGTTPLLHPMCAALMLLLAAEAADAQDQPGRRTGLMLEEVMVTARRVEEGLQSTPVAVTAISERDMQIRNMEDVRDLALATPNLVLQTSAANGGSQVPAIFIRGLGQADVTLTADPAVGMYLDGVYIARNSGNVLSLLELERVEVLRGPQGTLFGKNTIGGAINLVSKKAGPEFDAKAEISVGNYNMVRGKTFINMPLSDNLYAQVALASGAQDGYVDLVNYKGKALGDTRNLAGRVQLRWLATDALSIDWSADYSVTEDVGPPVVLLQTYPEASGPSIYNALLSGDPASCLSAVGQATNPVCFGPVHVDSSLKSSGALFEDRNLNTVDPLNDFTVYGTNLTVSWDLSFGTLRSISAYRKLESEFNFQGDHTPALVDGGHAKQQDAKQFSQELQLFGRSMDERLKWLVGAYYFDEESISRVEVYSPFALVIPGNVYPLLTDNFQPQSTKNHAVFSQATLDVKESLHLTAGLRWTRETKDSVLILLPSTPQGLVGENSVEKWTPMVSLSVDISDSAMAYVSYSEGFRSGGFPPRVIGQVTEIPSFEPETATTYELGVKAEFWDNRIRTNLALFTNKFEDFQAGGTNTTIVPPLGTVINAGNARINGAELEVELLISESLKLDGAFSALSTQLSSVNPTANENGVRVTDDNKLPFSPERKAALGITWDTLLPGGGELLGRLDLAYSSSMFFGLANQPESKEGSVTTVNGSLTYTLPDGHWQFSVGAKNLTDERYFTSKGASKTSGGTWTGVLAEPRTYFATVRWFYQ